MSGTFYHAPAPGEPPFVKVGDKVTKGQTIGIIEAMKLMNEIEVCPAYEVTLAAGTYLLLSLGGSAAVQIRLVSIDHALSKLVSSEEDMVCCK